MENASKYLSHTIEMAQDNVRKGHGGPFAALIVRNGEIIAATVNSVTSSNDPTAHAEVNAIREACRKLNTFQLDDCELYTSCEPCPMCLGAIYWARIRKVYYAATQDEAAAAGFDDSFIYQEIGKPHLSRNIPFVQVKIENANAPFRVWNQFEKKIAY